jgi:hypothetical protein
MLNKLTQMENQRSAITGFQFERRIWFLSLNSLLKRFIGKGTLLKHHLKLLHKIIILMEKNELVTMVAVY